MGDDTTDTALLTTDERFEKAGKDKEAVAKEVHADFKKAMDARIQKDRTFLEQYKIYRFHAKSRKFPWRSNIVVPKEGFHLSTRLAAQIPYALGPRLR